MNNKDGDKISEAYVDILKSGKKVIDPEQLDEIWIPADQEDRTDRVLNMTIRELLASLGDGGSLLYEQIIKHLDNVTLTETKEVSRPRRLSPGEATRRRYFGDKA